MTGEIRPEPKDWRDHVLIITPPGQGAMNWAREQSRKVPLRDWDARESDSQHLWRLACIDDRWAFGLRAMTDGMPGVPTPLRAPHHSVSEQGMKGGIAKGWRLRPGELSLSHGGVLLLDEANEFRLAVLAAVFDAMRRGHVLLPLEGGSVLRAPAEFRLIAVMRPCPCGFRGAERSTCRCTDVAVERWMKSADELKKHCRVVPDAEWRAELEASKGLVSS